MNLIAVFDPSTGLMEACAKAEVDLPSQVAQMRKGTHPLFSAPCPTCGGGGFVGCTTCNGEGDCNCSVCGADHSCGMCDGTGEVECPECDGTGDVDACGCHGKVVYTLPLVPDDVAAKLLAPLGSLEGYNDAQQATYFAKQYVDPMKRGIS